MLTSKQRANLKSIASNLKNEVLIGQNGITENLLEQINMDLDSRELVKIAILQNSELVAKNLINELATTLGAEPVLAIGRKMVLYRYSKKVKNHVEF